jgi:hypothetical protein
VERCGIRSLHTDITAGGLPGKLSRSVGPVTMDIREIFENICTELNSSG